MFKFDLRGLQRTEIWGIVIVACFNLALLAIAIRFGGLGPVTVFVLVAVAQVCSAVVIALLFQVRTGRDMMNDLHRAAELQTATSKAMAANSKDLKESVERLIKTLKELPCQKNLPPL